MRLHFHPEAEREFLDAIDTYESQVPGLGRRFAEDLMLGLELLVAHPEAGVAVDSQYRKFVLRAFPFVIIYFADESTLEINAVAHQRRHPDFWRARRP